MSRTDTNQFFSRNGLKLVLLGFAAALVSVALGGAGYAVADSTQFCGSCHSMKEPYVAWQASNHKQLLCTDCHLPHDSLINKLITKVQTGNRDVYHETLRDYPAAIMLTDAGRQIVNGNCRRSHQTTVENTALAGGEQDCTR
ncbi:MAG: NapC/NirT family cytochrome c, partial [Smithella sp.]